MRKLILAHDIGTTGNKATLYNPSGELLAASFYPYPTYYPRTNWAEQEPEEWWKAICISTRQLLKKARVSPGEVACISFSGQMMGCLPVDEKGNPLRRAIIWADQRGESQAKIFRQRISEEQVYKITGHRISPTYSASKIMWIKENEPQVFKDTHKILHAKDYIIFKLTGNFLTDYSDASGMNLFDLENKEWSEPILEATGVPREILPELHSSLEIAGELLPGAAEEVGLHPGIPVAVGGGDGPCASCGAGVVEEGSWYTYLGSSAWVAIATEEPVYDSRMRTFTFHHLHPHRYMPAGTMQAAGGSYQWIKENICKLETEFSQRMEVDPYKAMEMKAKSAPPGAAKLLFLPYLIGERSPHWNPNARGAFIGLSLTHNRGHIIRSVLEGIAFNMRIILDILEEHTPRSTDMVIIGGLAQSELFSQILADVFNRRIRKPSLLEEATSLGAAIAGGVATGLLPDLTAARELVQSQSTNGPDPENRRVYESLYQVFRKSYQALFSIYEELADIEE